MKGTSNTAQPTTNLEVVNPEVANLEHHSTAYFSAMRLSDVHRKGYAYLLGKALIQLKEIVGHGPFMTTKARLFPEKSFDTLERAQAFAQAVDSKFRTVRILDGQQLLMLEDKLPEATQQKVFEQVEKAAGDKGMTEVIRDWRKKTAPKPAPVDALQQEEEHQKNMVALFETAEAALKGVLELKEADFVLGGKALRTSVAGLCVRFGKLNRKLKAFKPKAAK